MNEIQWNNKWLGVKFGQIGRSTESTKAIDNTTGDMVKKEK